MLAVLTVVAIRLIAPLAILRYPLSGALLQLPIDYFDLDILLALGHHDLTIYQELDKTLDMYYLTLECYVSCFWTNKMARNTSLFLFVHRVVGFMVFSLSRNEAVLFVFPNVFEWFYLAYVGYKYAFGKELVTSANSAVAWVVIFTLPKMMHEYLLHINTTHPWSANKYIKPMLLFFGLGRLI